MVRLIGAFLFAFVSSLACAQSLLPEYKPCPRDFMHPNRVWSPDCRSYFVTSGSAWLAGRVPSVEVYSVGEKTTYVNNAVEEIRCDLAIESLGQLLIQLHNIEWVDSDRLRLQVRLLRYSNRIADYSYLVNAHTGKILETTFPTHRNWKCSASYASGGPTRFRR